jgi:hypothetical protein
MKILRLLTLLAGTGMLASIGSAQVPPMINYQGRVAVGGVNFNGNGSFKFALVGPGGTPSFWSNNGSSVNGSEPGAAVSIAVVNGLYSVQLGDATLPNMTAIPGTVFNNPDVRLRVWFNDGVSGSQLLTPDQRITSVGYAMMAGNVADGAITGAKIAPGAIGAAQIAAGAVNSSDIADGSIVAADIANNTIGSLQLADDLDLGDAATHGRLDIFHTAAGTAAITLNGSDSRISTYGSDGLEQIRLSGTSYGQMLLNDSTGNNTTVELGAEGFPLLIPQPFPNPPLSLPNPGAQLTLRSGGGTNRVYMKAGESGGTITLYQNDGGTGMVLDGDDGGAGAITVRSTNGSTRVLIDGANSLGGGEVSVRKSDGAETIVLDGSGAQISTYGSDGLEQIRLWGLGYGEILLKDSSVANLTAVRLSANGTGGGLLQLSKSDGTATITLDADVAGEGRITTQVIQITGGSDLSEKFDVTPVHDELKAGLIVSIDPENPGRLVTSSTAYDRTVAGIISGAGGVKPGMLMGQAGTAADGKHPVALSGRVYCWMDADQGAIRPGDLLTTSSTPGHGMKVTDHAQAQGAIIGKAMSSLEKGKGLVLVLVSLQ